MTQSSSTPATTTTVRASPRKANDMEITVHPLVLLSAADHYHRTARGTRKRAVGVLLGTVSKGKVDALNSFAVPFEEDSRNPAVFYLDHNYLENMLHMFRKINAKERVVGFYSTGPAIKPNDLRIYDIVRRFVPPDAVTPAAFVIIDVRPDRRSVPTTAYKAVEDAGDDGDVERTFAHVPSSIGAVEAEEVGVEHLLRDINDPTASTVAELIRGKFSAMSTLSEKLVEFRTYLESVALGEVRPNREILANLQTILNLLPNLNVEEAIRAILVKTNDMHMVIYLGALIRSVLALHDLVNNKIRYMDDYEEDNGNKEAKTKEKPLVEEKKEEK